jgi:hypothetical protein
LFCFRAIYDEFLVGGSPNPPSADQKLEKSCRDATDGRIGAVVSESAQVLGWGPIGLRIENQIIPLVALREVLLFVVDDVVKAPMLRIISSFDARSTRTVRL